MSEAMQSTDELVDDYTSARHAHSIYSGESVDHAVDAMNRAYDLEDKLVARGVSKDKLRAFWVNYAEANGLDH